MPQTLNMGPVRLAWRFGEGDPCWQQFQQAYAPYLDDREGQLTIEAEVFRVPEGAPRPKLPSSFIRARRLQGDDFDLGAGLIRGTRLGPDRLICTIHPALLKGTGLRVLEQFIYLLFHTVVLDGAEHEDATPFLLHSSGVLHQGQAFVFCGPPGSGKSTSAALCPARPLLSDEALVFVPGPDFLQVQGSPINPFCTDKEPGGGRLAGLCLLEHGPEHELLPITRAEAVPRLTAEVIVPLGLYEVDLSRGMARALDRALRLYESGKVNLLRFRPDPGFWDLLKV